MKSSVEVSPIENLLRPGLSALSNADLSYTAALASDLQKGINDTAGGHLFPVGDATKYWKDFSGSIFLLATGISVTLEIVLWLVMGFSLGAAFVVGIVVGIAMSVATQNLAKGSQPFASSAYDRESPLSSALVWIATNQLNESPLGPTLKKNTDYMSAMNVSADTLGLILTGGSLVAAIVGIAIASADAAAVLGLILAVVGFFTALAALSSANFFWGCVSVVTDIESLAVDWTSWNNEGGDEGVTGVVNAVGFGFDGLSFVIDFKSALSDGP